MLKIPSIILIVCTAVLYFTLSQKSSITTHSVFFSKGDSLFEIMKKDGSFEIPQVFLAIDKIDGIKDRIDTGEYILSQNESALSLINKMISKNKVTRKITFPEGYTVKMIAEKLDQNNLLRDSLTELPAEGAIMPDTYFYQFGDSRASIINKMKNEMRKFTEQIKSKNKTNLSMNQVITLASIVEKETGNMEEVELIASVFHNRLAKKMRLQSDPTIIYGISKGYGKIYRDLTREDLFFESEYNTYRKNGIPPTPICCPGKRAILAVMNPPKTDFLYFVADGAGERHRFSRDFKSHKFNIKLRKKEIISNH